ncbi:uncharacterized protein LOC134710056 isoform X2 [Mytilus trossulus]|uniref:uncharacterized protein LOC134710056 isoform X2 n=1 Tax=Mytilus trossulus TaxID=6551 RepID=UPI003004777B
MWCCKDCVGVMETGRGIYLQRRQALRRKGFVWHKAKSLSRLSEGGGNLSLSADNLSSWRPKSRSSLELAPALLSIYDSIAARTNGGITCSITNGNNQNKKINTDNQSSPVNVDDNDESVDNLCKMASTSSIVSVDQDCKKRPLSISSMSSTSSSSLTRHTRKRPNLTPFDQRSSGDFDDKIESTNNNFSDRLDHLLYIDDDVPSGTTDEEMSVDTDAGSKSSAETNCEQVLTPSQSKDSLITPSSSAQTQEAPETSVQIQDSPEPGLQRRDSTSPQKYVSYVQRVVTEIIETERIYINNLKDILEGYMGFIRNSPELKISEDHITALFGNIEEIYDFGKDFLHDLEMCGDDPVKVAECFVKNNDGFRIYAQYCTNYPSAVEVLTMIMKDPDLCEIFKHQQLSLNHNLPLGAYLLKPVQRVLKYHLLLQNILKNYSKSEPGHDTLTKAMDHMTSMAHHINEMKRKHEHAVRVQEIQSQLEDYDGEDLTRLGELVLEGSFRIYGAKTSRQVFLFDRGVLIGKRKEDGMLLCRVMIQCSNLMLVESIPKEPLSFQVIPFDNPKGYITLQARNLDTKRKWCQEIKRLIIESFKGKIPEKVKGLVMQLGKSREEEAAKYSTVDSRRISHQTAPEYLERRQRLRRKSGTAILTDLLKPQRGKKGQRRAESVSPRSSPPPERKVLTHSPSTPSTREVLNISNVDTPTLHVPKSVSPTKVGRSISFRQALKRQPLRSVDFGPLDNKENTSQVKQETPTSSRRSKSFKRATKLKPLLSVSNDTLESITPNGQEQDAFYTPSKKSAGLEFSFSSPSTPSENSSSPKTFNKFMRNETEKLCNENSGSLSRHSRYSSMPVLNTMESSSPLIRKQRKCSEEITSQENSSMGKKRIFDTKMYFKRAGNNSPDLRRRNNSVLAFHDSFIKKSTENLSRKSTESLSQKVGPITLTKPRPFISSPFDKPKKQNIKKSISCGAESGEVINEDPWERKTTTLVVPQNHTRTHSIGCEGDIDKMDWLVYANRNSLPVNGFDIGPKLYKYCTPPRSTMDLAQSQIKREHLQGDNSVRIQKGDNHLDFIKHMSKGLHFPSDKSKSDNCLDDNYINSEELNDFPNFGALPVVKVAKSQPKLNRSNSNPTSTLQKHPLRHFSSPSLCDDHHIAKDHEQIIAEMEDYLKRSESTSTVSSVKFPSNVTNNPVEIEENKRDSCVSNFSNSSYESTDTAPGSPGVDNFMGSLKHKIHDLKQKLSHRRSGSYDNRDSSDNELDNDKLKPKETRSSLLSLFHNKAKEGTSTNLQTVLHAGDWGSPSIGQRMAEQEPTYFDITLSLTRPKDKSDQYKVDVNGQTKPANNIQIGDLEASENLHLQNCDSAFSIQGDMAFGNNIDDSPRSQSSDDKSEIKRSLSSTDSIYEKQFSIAFDDGEPFRDSAVYCEMDPDQNATKSDLKLPNRVPIKSYVQKIEEKTQPIAIPVTKVKQREPGAIIKKRLESLHTNCFKASSRPSSVERELRFYSRPSSVERELRISSRPASEERQVRSVSVDKELPPRLSEFDRPSLRREMSDATYRLPSLNRYSDEMSTTVSTSRLDQLNIDLNNLIVMRGWVRQLIDKFQQSKN